MVDSRGQYLEGTTDITRTFHYDLPTEDMVTRYTEVLAGKNDKLGKFHTGVFFSDEPGYYQGIGDSGSSRL